MFASSSDGFTHDHVAGCRTLLVNTFHLHVCIAGGLPASAKKEYGKSKLPIHLFNHLLIVYCVSDTGSGCRDTERKDLVQLRRKWYSFIILNKYKVPISIVI